MRKGKRTFASRKRKIAGLCAIVLAGVIGLGAYAFTASNTFSEETGAGGGKEAVSGYEISPLHFTLKEGTATEVEFKITKSEVKEAEATEAEVSIYKAGGTPVWTACTVAAGPPAVATCKFAKALDETEVEEDTEHEVIATS